MSEPPTDPGLWTDAVNDVITAWRAMDDDADRHTDADVQADAFAAAMARLEEVWPS